MVTKICCNCGDEHDNKDKDYCRPCKIIRQRIQNRKIASEADRWMLQQRAKNKGKVKDGKATDTKAD